MSVLLHDLDRIEPGVYFLSVDVNDDDVPMYILGKNNGVRSTFYALGQIESVPPHGDLIDRGELKRQGYFFPCAIGAEYAIPLRALREAPTIIPAEEAET